MNAPTHIDDELAMRLRRAHADLTDPDASYIWTLLEQFKKSNCSTLPLHELERELVARVLK